MGPPGTVRHPSLWCVCEEKVFLCVYAESSLSALFSSSRCVCTFLHILLLPPQKITLCFFVYLQHMFGGFFYILASSTLYLLSPRFTESLDVFCWSCSVLRLNPLCTQQPVFLVSCTGGGSSYCGQGGALGSVLLWLCGSVGSSTVCLSNHTASLPHTVHCRGFLWVVLCQWDKTWLNCVSLSVAWKHPEPWCDLSCIYPLIVYVVKHIILELED